jgi:GTP-binding protein Era
MRFQTGATRSLFPGHAGFHKPRTRLAIYGQSSQGKRGGYRCRNPYGGAEGERRAQEAELIERIRSAEVPAVLVINKIDSVKKEELLPVIAAYTELFDFDAVVPVSARTGEGVEGLFEVLSKFASEGPQLFPDGMVTDQPERQIIAEILREKLLICLESEVPHGTAVEVTRFREGKRNNRRRRYRYSAK